MDIVLIPAVLMLMIISLILIVVPVVPVPTVEWTIMLIFAALTGFQRVTVMACVVATVLMIIGATSGFWMPLFGMRGREMSCLGIIAFFAGLMLGTAFIPIPFCGSFIGVIVAVFIVQLAQMRDVKAALVGSGRALELTLYGMVAEFFFGVMIIGVYCISILTTQVPA